VTADPPLSSRDPSKATTRTAIRVLVTVEHAVTRAGLVTLLSGHPNLEVVGSTDSLTYAVELARARNPHVIIVSRSAVDESALRELIERLHAADCVPGISVVYISTADHTNTVLASDALHSGVAGYFQLDIVDSESLAAAISLIVLSKAVVVMPADDLLNGTGIHGAHQTDEHEHILAALTDRESDVLYHVGQGLNNKEIAVVLNISEPTVKKHLSRALTKIHQPNRLRAALFIRDSSLHRLRYAGGSGSSTPTSREDT
jgi:DNA-binding NarL/FixJ family response regulator